MSRRAKCPWVLAAAAGGLLLAVACGQNPGSSNGSDSNATEGSQPEPEPGSETDSEPVPEPESESESESGSEPEPEPPDEQDARELSLRGDPNFDPAQLSDEARMWYERSWAAIRHPNPGYDVEALASSDNLYDYARSLHREMTSWLTVLRATGDLEVLDEIDGLAQRMRAELSDGWCDGLGGEDGYLNWRYRRHPDSDHWCRDVHVMEEMLTHANVAHFAYAFHLNRDLSSPGGVDYGERADFWLDYLENHFEAKWRERNGRPWPQMDFLTRSLIHPHVNFIRYYHYMHEMTGKDEYREFAEATVDDLLDSERIMEEHSGGLLEVSTPLGTGIVWAHRHEDWEPRGQMSTYVRYMANAAYDLAMEGVHRFDDELVHKMGVSIAHFILISEPPLAPHPEEVFGPSIVGSAGISTDSWTLDPSGSSFSVNRYVHSQYHVPLIFMQPGEAYEKMRGITLDAYAVRESDEDEPRHVHIPAVMLAEEVRRAGG